MLRAAWLAKAGHIECGLVVSGYWRSSAILSTCITGYFSSAGRVSREQASRTLDNKLCTAACPASIRPLAELQFQICQANAVLSKAASNAWSLNCGFQHHFNMHKSPRLLDDTQFLLEELRSWSARPVRTANESQTHPTQTKTVACFGPGVCQKSCSHGRLWNNHSHTRLQLLLTCGEFFGFMGGKNMQQPEWSLHISAQKAPCCIAHLAFFAQAF